MPALGPRITIVEFKLTDAEFGYYNNNGAFVVEPGEFDIMVGGNSQTGLTTTLKLK
ncbi:MAG: fibronectin type III-like domain-contianing protein [Saprospiraceae bacterium]|nr:fibronectin type III-like domain-contianing protein [Saprospiraceae bacterium]